MNRALLPHQDTAVVERESYQSFDEEWICGAKLLTGAKITICLKSDRKLLKGGRHTVRRDGTAWRVVEA